MKTDIYFKNYDGDAAVRDDINLRLKKVDKYFLENSQAKVTVNELRGLVTVEITVHVNNQTYLRVEVVDKDLRSAVDQGIDRLEAQIKKYKDKLQKKDATSIRYDLVEEIEENIEGELKIVKSKKFALKPMDEQEAALQMELLGHVFYMFLNSNTEDVNVIYKRKDGNYGLIEPEM